MMMTVMIMMIMMMMTPMQQKASVHVFFFTHSQYGHSIAEELHKGPKSSANTPPLPQQQQRC
jgi:hypothetical protein